MAIPIPQVFLSHNSDDKPQVIRLARELGRRGISVWLDISELEPNDWLGKKINAALENSAVVLACIGAAGKGPWHDREIEAARQRKIDIRLVLLPGWTKERGLLELDEQVGYRFHDNWDQAAQQLMIDLGGRLDGIKPNRGSETEFAIELPFGNCPYPGINHVFEPEHAKWFFGREETTAKLLDKLRRDRWVWFIGNSGSGKSSTARAGVMAWWPKSSEHSLGVASVFMPSAHAHLDLDGALSRLCESMNKPLSDIENQALQGRKLNWHACLRERAQGHNPPPPWLLVIDQAERMFGDKGADPSCLEMMERLWKLWTDEAFAFHVLVVLRTDWQRQALGHPRLRQIWEKTDVQVCLAGMSRDPLEKAIQMPARAAGGDVEPALVHELVNAVLGSAAGLPLLQIVLQNLWPPVRKDAMIQWVRADENKNIFAEAIEDRVKKLAKVDLERLVEVLVMFDEFGAIRGKFVSEESIQGRADEREISSDLKTLVEARLLVAEDGGWRLAHEAVLEVWKDLTAAVERRRADLSAASDLQRQATNWTEHQRDPAGLLRGSPLAAKERLVDYTALGTEAKAFLRASLDLRRREANRRKLAIVAGVVVAALATAAGIVTTIVFQKQKREQESAADEARDAKGEARQALAVAEEKSRRLQNLVLQEGAEEAYRQGDWTAARHLLDEQSHDGRGHPWRQIDSNLQLDAIAPIWHAEESILAQSASRLLTRGADHMLRVRSIADGDAQVLRDSEVEVGEALGIEASLVDGVAVLRGRLWPLDPPDQAPRLADHWYPSPDGAFAVRQVGRDLAMVGRADGFTTVLSQYSLSPQSTIGMDQWTAAGALLGDHDSGEFVLLGTQGVVRALPADGVRRDGHFSWVVEFSESMKVYDMEHRVPDPEFALPGGELEIEKAFAEGFWLSSKDGSLSEYLLDGNVRKLLEPSLSILPFGHGVEVLECEQRAALIVREGIASVPGRGDLPDLHEDSRGLVMAREIPPPDTMACTNSGDLIFGTRGRLSAWPVGAERLVLAGVIPRGPELNKNYERFEFSMPYIWGSLSVGDERAFHAWRWDEDLNQFSQPLPIRKGRMAWDFVTTTKEHVVVESQNRIEVFPLESLEFGRFGPPGDGSLFSRGRIGWMPHVPLGGRGNLSLDDEVIDTVPDDTERMISLPKEDWIAAVGRHMELRDVYEKGANGEWTSRCPTAEWGKGESPCTYSTTVSPAGNWFLVREPDREQRLVSSTSFESHDIVISPRSLYHFSADDAYLVETHEDDFALTLRSLMPADAVGKIVSTVVLDRGVWVETVAPGAVGLIGSDLSAYETWWYVDLPTGAMTQLHGFLAQCGSGYRWSPDGRWLASACMNEVTIIDLHALNDAPLTLSSSGGVLDLRWLAGETIEILRSNGSVAVVDFGAARAATLKASCVPSHIRQQYLLESRAVAVEGNKACLAAPPGRWATRVVEGAHRVSRIFRQMREKGLYSER